MRTSNPAPFEGSQYFFAGNAEAGFVKQTVDLLALGYTPEQLDSQNLEAVFVAGFARSRKPRWTEARW